MDLHRPQAGPVVEVTAVEERQKNGGKRAAAARPPKSDIELAHRKPRVKRRPFASDRERAESRVADEVGCLVPLLPRIVIETMLSGERDMRQVPDPAKRAAMLTRMLSVLRARRDRWGLRGTGAPHAT